jgi:hypothetical protein
VSNSDGGRLRRECDFYSPLYSPSFFLGLQFSSLRFCTVKHGITRYSSRDIAGTRHDGSDYGDDDGNDEHDGRCQSGCVRGWYNDNKRLIFGLDSQKTSSDKLSALPPPSSPHIRRTTRRSLDIIDRSISVIGSPVLNRLNKSDGSIAIESPKPRHSGDTIRSVRNGTFQGLFFLQN